MSRTIADGLSNIMTAKTNIDTSITNRGGVVTGGLVNTPSDINTIPTGVTPEEVQAMIDASVETAVATYRGTYTTIETLNAASGDENDYAFYKHTDTDGNTVLDKYIFIPTEQADLPEGYTQLLYIESNGTQYIDTGINPNRDTKFYLKFSPVEYHYGTYYFGTYGLSDRGYYDKFSLSADNAMVNLQVIGGDNFIDISVGDIAEISVEYPYYSADGTTLTLPTVDAVTFSGTNTICLFTAKRDGSISTAFNSYMRLYACQIYENDGTTLAADYIPCKNASNVLGLYDLVNEIFLPNQGSDTFIAGPQANGYWNFEFSIPGNLFSSTQFGALNSGINSTKVAQIETNKNNILSKQDTLVVGTNLDDEPIEDSTNPITSGGVYNTVGNLDAALDSLIMSLEPKTITENGTYNPADDGVDGYSEVTVNVSSGGGSSGTDVVFYDYDGSVVASYSAADFANLSAMPANPTHTGLTAQGWNWSLVDAKAYVAANGKLDIGQMYITSDGKTRLHFVVPKDNLGIELHLYLDDDTELDIDWGDDSEHTRCTSSDTEYHDYDSAGRHDVTITVINGSFEFAVTYDGDNYTLQNVEIGNGVTLIRDFVNCYTLTSITIPNGVTSIGGGAFSNCYALTSITIPNSVTNLDAYDHSFIFSNCYALTSITIPNSVTSIEDHAFQDCYALSSITIPNSVTSIGGNAFDGCQALSSITIPSSVTSIGSSVFSNCYALSSITFVSTTPPALDGDIQLPTTCVIRVPQGTLSDYTSASNYPDPSYYIYEEY